MNIFERLLARITGRALDKAEELADRGLDALTDEFRGRPSEPDPDAARRQREATAAGEAARRASRMVGKDRNGGPR